MKISFLLQAVVLAVCVSTAVAGEQTSTVDPMTKFVNLQDDRFVDLLAVQEALKAADSEAEKAAILTAYQHRDSVRAQQSGLAMGQAEKARQQTQATTDVQREVEVSAR